MVTDFLQMRVPPSDNRVHLWCSGQLIIQMLEKFRVSDKLGVSLHKTTKTLHCFQKSIPFPGHACLSFPCAKFGIHLTLGEPNQCSKITEQPGRKGEYSLLACFAELEQNRTESSMDQQGRTKCERMI